MRALGLLGRHPRFRPYLAAAGDSGDQASGGGRWRRVAAGLCLLMSSRDHAVKVGPSRSESLRAAGGEVAQPVPRRETHARREGGREGGRSRWRIARYQAVLNSVNAIYGKIPDRKIPGGLEAICDLRLSSGRR